MADTKIYSVSCPDLTVIHEWTDQKLNSIKITKSLPNMAFVCYELEKETKNTDVSKTFKIEEHDKKFSASCPNLTLKHEWTDQKLNAVKITKSLPNMALLCHELKVDTKNTGVCNTFEIEKHTEKLSASCPNLMQNHELTIKKLNCDNKTKSLPNMVLSYSDELEVKKAYDSEKITEIECAKEEIEIPKKKRRTIYKRVKLFFKGLCCCCAKL
ncbi:hypothetical protein AGLY_001375 [Aphis glycines]|uniref:Uncharacterized protein n=1 Tax=Aphis glycines TaxID=307491 RepID=A0A6G0U7J6_APHGL|nr:hypothetical protein AGLY_001375 [Aphis glycines]